MNDIMEERFEGNPNVQTKISRNIEGQNEPKKYKITSKNCMCEGNFGNGMEKLHYVGPIIG